MEFSRYENERDEISNLITFRHSTKERAPGIRAQYRQEEIRQKLDREFASSRGWTYSTASHPHGKPFSFKKLADKSKLVLIDRVRGFAPRYRVPEPGWPSGDHRLVDHPTYFKLNTRPYQPVAILAHSYDMNRANHEAYAESIGIRVEFLPWSWYYPGRCLAALYVKP
jgi:hypothetical protein